MMVWLLWVLGQNTDNLQQLARYSGLVKVRSRERGECHRRWLGTGEEWNWRGNRLGRREGEGRRWVQLARVRERREQAKELQVDRRRFPCVARQNLKRLRSLCPSTAALVLTSPWSRLPVTSVNPGVRVSPFLEAQQR